MARPTEGQDPWFADITAYFDGLESVDQTNAAAAVQNAAALQTHINAPNPHNVTAAQLGLGNVDNTHDVDKPISTATQQVLDTKAPQASPAFTGTVSGITKSMVGLGSVDNTSDASKPISTLAQTALDLKAPLDSPNFTGTATGIDQSMVGLDQVDNTADVDKPVSSAAQVALDTQELKLCQMLGRPTHPGNLDVSDRTTTTVTLVWNASVQPPGGSTTNYRVYQNGTQVATGITATTKQVTGLVSNTSYEFYVVPYNTTGDGPTSDVISATTLDSSLVAPTVPTGVQVTSFSSSEVDLAWTNSTSVYGPLLGYKIYRDNVQIGTSATATYSDATVSPSTTYVYKVAAYNALGDSAASDVVTVPTPAAVTAPAVRGSFSYMPATTVSSPYTATLPAGIQNSDVGYVVVFIGDGTNTPTAVSSPSGAWSLVDGPQATGTSQRGWLYRKSLTASDASGTITATISGGSTRSGLIGTVLSGARLAHDALVASAKSTNNTVLTIPAITPTVNSTRLVMLSSARFTQTTGNKYNMPGGWTVHQNLRSANTSSPQLGALVASQVLNTGSVAFGSQTGSFDDTATNLEWVFTAAPVSVTKASAPQNLRYSARTSSSITWVWSAPAYVPAGDPVTGYNVYSSTGTLLANVSAGTTTYQRNGLSASTAYGLWVAAVTAGAGEGDPSPVVTVTTGAAPARFAGDPGVSKMYLGATSGTYTNDWFDKRIFPGATVNDPPTKRFKLARVYNSSGKFLIDSGSKTKLTAHAAAGRIPILTWKGITQSGGPYSLQDIVNGLADADIDANATYLAGMGGAVWWGFFHEPENLNSPINPALMDLYRAAYRRQITRIRAIANNVAFCSPFFSSTGSWYANRGSYNDLRWFHPNYTGDPRTQGSPGGGQWLTDGPFSGSWVNMDGLDYYNPKLGSKLDSNSRNQTFMGKFQDFLDTRTADGWYTLPVAIGEGGFYNELATLDDNGTTNQVQFHDLITNGTTAGVVGCVFWNNSEAFYDDTKDLNPTVGAKSAALGTEVGGNLTKVVMG